jgi:lipoprotein-anchoring transpeptidase ErfK/SrfK
VARNQATVTIAAPHLVGAYPPGAGVVVARGGARRPITGGPTVLPIIGSKTDAAGRAWLQVRLPGRAPGSIAPPRTGWLLANRTTRSTTAWHVVVDRATRLVTVYRQGRVQRRYRVIVGAPRTPTPSGSFFVEENVRMPATTAGAPFALAISARSAVLHEFAGGPGQIALHGTDNVGGQLGTAVSHGCIRLDRAAITWLASNIAAGTPITIR